MNLAAPGVFCFLDSLAGSALGPFARKVERLGYSVLCTRRALAERAYHSAPIS